MRNLKVGIVDDHVLFLKGFQLLLQTLAIKDYKLDITQSVSDHEKLISSLSYEVLDLIFLDLNLGNADGIKLIPTFKTRLPECRVIVVSATTEPKTVREAFRQGADGYLSKYSNPEDIVQAIQTVMLGEIYLGPGIRPNKVDLKNPVKAETAVSMNRYNAKFVLTKREIEILEKVMQGKSSKIIAAEMYISKETVNVHRRNMMKKLGVNNSVRLVKLANELNLMQ
ncbi:MAG: response regulator transcription factor [Saprospiraceae bacterium]|nr:response regulator transcription factor [Saprospiraceae bacterium]